MVTINLLSRDLFAEIEVVSAVLKVDEKLATAALRLRGLPNGKRHCCKLQVSTFIASFYIIYNHNLIFQKYEHTQEIIVFNLYIFT